MSLHEIKFQIGRIEHLQTGKGKCIPVHSFQGAYSLCQYLRVARLGAPFDLQHFLSS